MSTPDPILDEIKIALGRPNSRDDPERLERILTDGYARALGLEVERSRLQKQIGELAADDEQTDRQARRELSTLVNRLQTSNDDLGRLRALLIRLRSRYTVAASRR